MTRTLTAALLLVVSCLAGTGCQSTDALVHRFEPRAPITTAQHLAAEDGRTEATAVSVVAERNTTAL